MLAVGCTHYTVFYLSFVAEKPSKLVLCVHVLREEINSPVLVDFA